MIRTRFTDRFGVDHPVMLAPMAMRTDGRLAAAVSAAGGLGAFGGVTMQGPGWVTAQADLVRAAETDHEGGRRPFGVGFITPFLDRTEPLFAAALDARPDVVAFSFADPRPWLARAKDAGAQVICQVQTLADADVAVEAGADALVAQGNEAGGHTGTMGLLPFLAAVVERHPDVPVLAAGGIADGRTLAAALVAGADGAWVGTAFLAAAECEVADDYKQAIVHSDGGDTVFTSTYDIVSGLPWPPGIGERIRRDAFTDEWHGREHDLRQQAAGTVRPPTEPLLYGQSAAFVDGVRPAADILRRIVDDAERILRDRPSQLLR